MQPTYAEQAAPGAVVVGAGGYLGRHVCAVLRGAGMPVTALVRREAAAPPGCRTLCLDPLGARPAELAARLARVGPAVLVNAAGALWGVTDDQMAAGNVTLVDRLVRAAALLPDPVRLVHLGSAYEYGSHPGRKLVSEDLPERPAGRYAQTKLAGTRLVAEAAAAGLVDAVVLRVSLSLGPAAPALSLFGSLARQLAAEPEQLELPSVDAVRDMVDVRDVAGAVLCAARAGSVPPVVNIGGGTGVRVADAVELLVGISGSAARIRRVPAPPGRRDSGAGDQALDIGLARRRLGWSPTLSLPETLRALWDGVAPRTSARSPDPPAPHPTDTVDGDGSHG